MPSVRSRQWPRESGRSLWSSSARMRAISSAETPKLTAFTQYARSGPEAATSAPPTSGPAAVVSHCTAWSR